MSALDPRNLRDAFGRFMTGVTVVTCLDKAGQPVGFTANSFTSVSLDPPLLLVCPGKFLSSFEAFTSCTRFCVSILAEGQEHAANTFAGFKGDRFAKVAHKRDAYGIPLIEGAIATFSCATHQIVPAGDHSILMGQVTDFSQSEMRGLGYRGGQFFSLGLERQERDPAARRNVGGAIVKSDETVLLEHTSQGYRLPECVVPDHSRLRDCLQNDLGDRGIEADLGSVFSVFDDPEKGVHYAYLLARAEKIAPKCRLEAFGFSDLAGLTYASSTTARMMARYVEEARTQNFSLYLGDAERGGTHRLTERV
ncbi:MAG: flavin reductase family protein [Roseibium sp.]|uniref:flavin reductase family protein n=1 Tax=Roseibium sp. TaxID=1936156 RepID=UPI00261F3B16|nr:flavin reductase family protein [Roseibium sp.]MCV0427178.1 flavin reductase family protein [Roseibium sp.]